jgi:phosphatidylserine/phosphatidylglycerophosphate/cardiolipin synthase-like enzyme
MQRPTATRRSRLPGLLVLPLLLVAHAPALASPPLLQLVESFPIETTLGNPDLPEAHDVWLQMIESARFSLDFAEFYASNAPDSRLEPIVRAIEAAAQRGVRVRFLAENNFYSIYPETLERLARHTNIEVRRDSTRAADGGVLHAKYFIVDGREAFVGSQNFDWRALTHILELGLRVRIPSVVEWLFAVFERDWLSAGGDRGLVPHPNGPVTKVLGRQSNVFVTTVFSPKGPTVSAALWDLPRIVKLIDAAQQSVRVQLLTYRASDRDGSYFADLEAALRRAAARGVPVQMLLADWCKRKGTIEGLQSLQCLPNLDVKLVSIPEWSGGFIPFARVVHAKYLVVDARAAWLGSSNWEKDYFFASRNVGLIVEGGDVPGRLDEYFLRAWSSDYAELVEPGATYEAPRIRD